jgi:hypothetical protein
VGEHPKGAALSGEGRDNLRDNLWAELSKWQQRSELLMRLFTKNNDRIFAKDHPETWFLSARSYPSDADSEAIGRSLSGLHSRYPFILLDETGDMPLAVGQKATQIFTGGVVDGLICQAGNPTSTSGLLYHSCVTGRELWNIITITADPDDPKRTPRVPLPHAREQIELYGRDNPWVMSTILGEFPKQGFNTLISLDDVEKAMRRQLRPEEYEYSQKRLGIDAARFGDDRSTIFPRQGLNAARPKFVELRNMDGPQLAARAATARFNWGQTGTTDILEFVDGTGGYGSSCVDSLRQAGYTPIEVQAAGLATDSRFFNMRAQMWWNMAGWVKKGALPNHPGLVKELTAPTYTFKNGKILIEPKELIKKRLGVSPDLADGLAQTFALPDMPAQFALPGMPQPGQMLVDQDSRGRKYDPFERD